MKIGDVVYFKKENSLMGEIKAIDEMDRATLSLCNSRVEITVDMAELGETNSVQAHSCLLYTSPSPRD